MSAKCQTQNGSIVGFWGMGEGSGRALWAKGNNKNWNEQNNIKSVQHMCFWQRVESHCSLLQFGDCLHFLLLFSALKIVVCIFDLQNTPKCSFFGLAFNFYVSLHEAYTREFAFLSLDCHGKNGLILVSCHVTLVHSHPSMSILHKCWVVHTQGAHCRPSVAKPIARVISRVL